MRRKKCGEGEGRRVERKGTGAGRSIEREGVWREKEEEVGEWRGKKTEMEKSGEGRERRQKKCGEERRRRKEGVLFNAAQGERNNFIEARLHDDIIMRSYPGSLIPELVRPGNEAIAQGDQSLTEG